MENTTNAGEQNSTQTVGVTETATTEATRKIVSYIENRENISLKAMTKNVIRLICAEASVRTRNETKEDVRRGLF